MGKRKKKSNYAGAHLNQAVAETFFGPGRNRADDDLFVVDDGGENRPLTSREKARAKAREDEAREAFEKANADKLKSKSEAKRIDSLMAHGKRQPKSAITRNTKKSNKGENSLDIWGTEGESKNLQDADEWTSAPVNPLGSRTERQVRARKSTRHNVAAVKIAHPGASYNPSVKDHREALSKAVTDAIAFETRKQRLQSNPAKARASRMKDTPEDQDEDSSDDSSDESCNEGEEVPRDSVQKSNRQSRYLPVPGEKLTRVQRNKLKRKRAREVEERRKARDDALAADLDKADELDAEIEKDQEKWDERKARLEQLRKDRLEEEPVPVLSTGKRLKRAPFVDAVLPSDLNGTMRLMKPHGNFALDRFHSLHLRNKITLPDAEAFKRSKRKKRTKPVQVGKKFIEEEWDPKAARKKKRNRFMKHGKVDISL